MNLWRARCGESRSPGSEGGPEKRTSRKADTALRSDPYSLTVRFSGVAVAQLILADVGLDGA
ncbi:hypothetical protein Misp02_71160 [Microtetraspora sp. NBRC 16547]|nr:hypothetical protein Misp02_71160 [Microtetraspora sp. NBRC 16547]